MQLSTDGSLKASQEAQQSSAQTQWQICADVPALICTRQRTTGKERQIWLPAEISYFVLPPAEIGVWPLPISDGPMRARLRRSVPLTGGNTCFCGGGYRRWRGEVCKPRFRLHRGPTANTGTQPAIKRFRIVVTHIVSKMW